MHRNILIASSAYFDAMFSSGMQENEAKQVSLKDVNGEGLRFLVDFCYSGQIEITSENIGIILPTASRYEFVEIEDACLKFLEQSIETEPNNCASYYSLANLYNFNGSMELIKQQMCQFFMDVKETEEFLDLNYNEMVDLIKRNDLCVSREEEVFTSVMKWINRDKYNREKYLPNVLKYIRFPQMDIKVSHLA